ncbi:uncharacterized protein CCOS01_14836 [Colletotrichum costaricense]|uniref:CMP/dCMP-type deaminase domain-containing protein n=1 Tax=Colletotrichum costaricense TaxID=1209916 RepID=A0AAI9YI55_9PEZI|nr:uncharacterized protein CCOS01_14836 [Colletotrichum costaricense]KAK1511074.1 hypothetical protein CCOS01_14836 [Colletotrichum costaricense]
MEAALWIRVELVGIVLAAGANARQKDRDGRVAAGFAEENERNDEETEYRHVDYAEKPFKSKSRRGHIRALLGVAPLLQAQVAKSELANLFQPRFVKSPVAKTALLINPRRGIPIAQRDQTIRVFLRGRLFEPVVAVGGWTGGNDHSRLDSNYWAHKTLSFAKRIGLIFDEHELDTDSHQRFIENEDDRDRQIRLEILFHYQHMETLTKAEIVTSQKPCPSCLMFMEYLAKRMWLDFVVVVAEEIVFT